MNINFCHIKNFPQLCNAKHVAQATKPGATDNAQVLFGVFFCQNCTILAGAIYLCFLLLGVAHVFSDGNCVAVFLFRKTTL